MPNEGRSNRRAKKTIKVYLESEGYQVTTEENGADLVGRRRSETLVVEVQTAGEGAQQTVDNKFKRVVAQLLFRMNDFTRKGTAFALGLDTQLADQFARKLGGIRKRLGWSVFVVAPGDSVSWISPQEPLPGQRTESVTVSPPRTSKVPPERTAYQFIIDDLQAGDYSSSTLAEICRSKKLKPASQDGLVKDVHNAIQALKRQGRMRLVKRGLWRKTR